MSSKAWAAFFSPAVRSALFGSRIGLGQVVVDQGQLELALVQIRFHPLAGLRLGAIRSLGGQVRRRRQLGQPRWNFFSRLLELVPGVAQTRAGVGQNFSYCSLSFPSTAFAARSDSRAAFHDEVGPRSHGGHGLGMV